MKTKLFFVFAAALMAITACQKEDNDDTDNGNTEDYQPTTAGSTWQYNSTTQGGYTETATNEDTAIEGETYLAFTNDAGGVRYVNKSNGVYKSYSYFEAIDKNLKLTYLKDAAVGATWEDFVNIDYNGFEVLITFTHTILSRDGDKVVNSVTYNNVIGVGTRISASPLLVGGDGTVAMAQRFYAKGVGAISSSLSFDALGTTISDSTYLVSHDIK